MKFKLTRRCFLAGCALAGVGAVADTWLVEPRWLKQTRVKVSLKTASPLAPIRILHLSDFHESRHVPIAFIKKALELGLSHKPDLVCLTGDLINRRIEDFDQYASALALLSKSCPCYACVGNHDGGDWAHRIGGYADLGEMRRLLTGAGISLLVNSCETVSINGTSIQIVGLGDYWAENAKPERAFPRDDLSESMPTVVLSHNPDSKKLLRDYPWDLMLCGHTHGGQLSLPLVGTPFAPVRDQRYVYGLNRWDGRWIYTTSGVGNLHGLRFNCRPEVAIIEIC